jgi:hypothetical protein
MDIRVPVGAIFSIYGVLLIVWGFASGDLEPRHMIGPLNVNVWDGIGMLVFGVVLLLLARRSPRAPRSTMEQ